MNDERFDSWLRRLARGESRRGLLRAAVGALAAAAALGAGTRPRAGRAQADDLPPILHPLLGWTDAPVVPDEKYDRDTYHRLKNPERGMYYGHVPDSDDYHTIVAWWLHLDEVCDQELIWAGRDDRDTSPVLSTYAKSLDAVRAAGAKVLFRPRYDQPVDGNPPSKKCGLYHAKNLGLQENHIDAVAAMLGANQDVIAFIHAGYLGKWGEWNLEGGRETVPLLTTRSDRLAIMDRILRAYADNGVKQHVEFRRPVFVREALACKGNRGSNLARVGFHNDCFMSNDDDYATYSEHVCTEFNEGTCCAASDDLTPCDETDPSFCDGSSDADCSKFPHCPTFHSEAEAKDWAKWFTADANFGGETCPNDANDDKISDGDERWRSCSSMIGSNSEPASLHMSYLNATWHSDAVTTWRDGQCYDEIRRRLGYRFEVTRVEYTPTVAAGNQKFLVRVEVTNTGWAKLHKPRQAMLVLRDGPTALPPFDFSSGDVASWAPGQTTIISVNEPAPGVGKYRVWLWIPDPDAEHLPLYAVRLATLRDFGTGQPENVFNQATGENDLGIWITVQ